MFVGRSLSADIKCSRAQRPPRIERSEGPWNGRLQLKSLEMLVLVVFSSLQPLASSLQNRYL
jgi:hypothetical protein